MFTSLAQVSLLGCDTDAKKVSTSEVSPAPSSIIPGSTEAGECHEELSDLSEADSASEASEAGDANFAVLGEFGEGGEEEKEVVSVEHWSIVAARLATVFQSELHSQV